MTTNITSADGKIVAVDGGLTRTGYSFNTIAIKDLNPDVLKQILEIKVAPNPKFCRFAFSLRCFRSSIF